MFIKVKFSIVELIMLVACHYIKKRLYSAVISQAINLVNKPNLNAFYHTIAVDEDPDAIFLDYLSIIHEIISVVNRNFIYLDKTHGYS